MVTGAVTSGTARSVIHLTDIREALAAALADRYTLERELGRGGMAAVYLVHDRKHDRQVALKVLHPELAATLGTGRFLREIRLTARLDHPHILPVLDSGEAAGLLWYTMPYVRGESLRECLRRDVQLPVDVAIDFTRQAASALEHAHREGVVHRDLKPENILIADGQVRIADFGVAKALSGPDEAMVTETGLAVGTPAYMSPEQASGGQVDVRSDIYALGCVLYEMLAGEAPYTGPNHQAIAIKRLTDPVPSVRRLREVVPPAVEKALGRALAKVPADRFSSPSEFAKALGGGTGALSADAIARPGRQLRRTHMLVAGLGLMVILGLAAWLALGTAAGDTEYGDRRIAVLPFENLGDTSTAHFADGVSDEVRGKLAMLPGLEVIARTSSTQYRMTTKPPREVGEELGVRHLLTGTVRWEQLPGRPSRVRVSPELIDARSGSTKWQESFESAVTDVFRVQGEIAANVAEALQLRLTASAESALARRPTADLDAYDAYLRGLEIYDSGSDPTGEQARAALALAVRLDSTFALAWAQLALAEGRRFLNSHDASAAAAMRKATERALALAPELPAAHARVGEYQSWVRHDNPAALAAYRKGLTFSPNSALLLARVGWAEMRLGRWDSAVVHLVQASKLDPREPGRFADLAAAYLYLRRYHEAQSAMDRHTALTPASSPSINRRLWLALGKGDLTTARAVLRNIPPELDPLTVLADYPTWQKAWILDSSALRALVHGGEVERESRPAKALVLAEAHSRLGDSVRATAWGERAAKAYKAMLAESPDDPELLSGYGLALAYAGESEKAIEAGLRAKTLVPISSDAIAGQAYQAALARIYLLVGEKDLALDELEPVLQVPGSLSRDWLRIDPTFASLRGDARFERLVGGT